MNHKQLKYSLKKVIRAAENFKCKDMHHKKAHQHKPDELCPVEYELSKHIQNIQQHFNDNLR